MSSLQQTVELLDSDKIKSVIDSNNLHCLAALDVFDSINSTNTYLLECAKVAAPSGSVCFAEQQTQGRGRLGRVWYSPRGSNIYCSLLWYFSSYQKDLGAFSIAVAVVVVQALKKYGIQGGMELKWPNDILFSGRKIAGILLERLPEKNGKIPIVIGVGLNLHLPKDEAVMSSWIGLDEIVHPPVARNYLAGLLVNELLTTLNIYQTQGVRPFLDCWRLHNTMSGKEIVVHTPTEKITGIMIDISEQGELLLKRANGKIQRFQCGEVSVRTQS